MQGKQHSTERKQADIPSAQHLITQTGLQQGIEHKPAVAHAYQRVSSGQQRTTSPADMLTLQRSIGNQAVQRLVTRTTQGGTELAQRKENRTGLPDRLKAGAERLSGVSLDDVNVHYNSSQPAQLQALAYTQGTDIHVGPGQERHLAHEAWHVVQQKQGRVLPTLQAKGMAINDDPALEREADVMGERANDTHKRQESLAPELPQAENRSIQRFIEEADVIQRAVGFEFEIQSVHTYQKNPLGRKQSLRKKERIIEGPGFNVEADEMPGYSDLEFVTDAFPETVAGGSALAQTLQEISATINALSKKNGIEIAANTVGIGTATKNRFFQPTQDNLVGKPQATAGVRLDALNRLFREVQLRPLAPAAANNARVMFGGQMDPLIGTRNVATTFSGMSDVGNAVAATDKALMDVNNAVMAESIDNPVIGGPELRALVTSLVMYLVQGAIGSAGYGKLIAGSFLARTDFATVFKQLLGPLHEYLTQNGNTFIHLVMVAAGYAAKSVNYKGNMSINGPVFEGSIYNDPGMYGNSRKFQSKMPQLSRYAWLQGIVQGTDLLTAVNYPGKKKDKEEIESLGSYGSKMDTLNSGQAPIIEFRGLKELHAGLFLPMALDLFRYVHILNSGGLESYPGQLLDLSLNDKGDLITNTGNATNIRTNIIATAMAEISLLM